MRNPPVFTRLPITSKPALVHPSGEGALSFTSNDGCTYTGGRFSFSSNDGVTIASFSSNDGVTFKNTAGTTIASFSSNDGCTFSSNDGVTIVSFSSNDGVTFTPPLRFKSSSGNHYTTFRSSPSQNTTIDYTWPTTLPPTGGVLSANASGALSWSAASGGGPTTIEFNNVAFDGSNTTTSDRFFDNTAAVWSTQYYYGPGGTASNPTLAANGVALGDIVTVGIIGSMGPNAGFLVFARPVTATVIDKDAGQVNVLHLAVTVIRHTGDQTFQSNNTLNFKVFKP